MSNDKVEPTFKPIDIDEKILDDDEDSEQVSVKIYPERGRYQEKPPKDKADDITIGEPATGNRYNSWRNTYSRDYSAFLSVVGRLDRFRACIGIFAATFLALLFISAMDKFVKLVLLMFNQTAVTDNGFQIKPIYYIVIGITFWLISLLIIAMGRLRDINKSPWLSIVLLIPGLNLLIVAYCVLPGTKSDNRYGPTPQHYGILTYLSAITFLGLVPVLILTNINDIFQYYNNIVSIHQRI